MSVTPTFNHELLYWQQGIHYIAGVDEAGMGAWAGPVVAAAVIWKQEKEVQTLRDSKLLSPTQREKLSQYIKDHAVAWGVGQASVGEISQMNIRQASHLAMRRAVDQLPLTPELLLIDGLPAQPHPTIPSQNIIDGDALCISIAAASIIAKVQRDKLLIELDQQFPHYGFAAHKGYGTALHQAALQTYGVSPHHRPTYAPIVQLLTKSAKSDKLPATSY